MSEEFQLPDIMDISPEATAAAEATLDPEVYPPDTASKNVDKKSGAEYFRWTELFAIEKVQRSRTKSGLTQFYIQARVRPGEVDNGNVGKRVFSRYRVNFSVLSGAVTNPGHEIMNRLSLASIMSLLRATGYAPTDKTAGLPAALLTSLFPLESDAFDSPLVGKVAFGVVVNSPNNAENAKRKRDNEVETWMAVPATEE